MPLTAGQAARARAPSAPRLAQPSQIRDDGAGRRAGGAVRAAPPAATTRLLEPAGQEHTLRAVSALVPDARGAQPAVGGGRSGRRRRRLENEAATERRQLAADSSRAERLPRCGRRRSVGVVFLPGAGGGRRRRPQPPARAPRGPRAAEAGAGARVPVPVLRQDVRHELESEDPFAGAHRREAVRLQTLRRHVQAEGALAETLVFCAPQCDFVVARRRAERAL